MLDQIDFSQATQIIRDWRKTLCNKKAIAALQKEKKLLKKHDAMEDKKSIRLTVFFLILAVGLLVAFIVQQGPKSDDTRKYSELTHTTFINYPNVETTNVSVNVNEAAQNKLTIEIIDSLLVMSNRDCNKLLQTHIEITSVTYEEVFVSVYEGSPYIHLDIKLKTFENSSTPKPKKFHQTFNILPGGPSGKYTTGKSKVPIPRDSIVVLETKFLY